MVGHLRTCRPSYELVKSGDVLNMVTRVMRLTRGKLLKQPDWDEWQTSEYLQLDQYDAQGMFGQPVPMVEDMSVFHSVWTYAIKNFSFRRVTTNNYFASSRTTVYTTST